MMKRRNTCKMRQGTPGPVHWDAEDRMGGQWEGSEWGTHVHRG